MRNAGWGYSDWLVGCAEAGASRYIGGHKFRLAIGNMTQYSFVHLEFGAEHRELSMALIARFRAELQRPGDRIGLVIVDNASSTESRYSGHGFENVRVLPGDNSNREFSGWDAGVQAELARSGEADIWIFTNDTVARHHGWSDRRAARFGQEIERLGSYSAPWILGEVHDFQRAKQTPLGPQLEYIVTYGFALNASLRRALGTISPGNDLLDSLVHDSYEPEHRLLRDCVDADFAENRLIWLIGDAEDLAGKQKKFGWAEGWHSRAGLSAETFDDLRMKVRCVLSETLLSVRAQQLGAMIRSPYDARNGRARIRALLAYLDDRLWERRFKRRLQKAEARADEKLGSAG